MQLTDFSAIDRFVTAGLANMSQNRKLKILCLHGYRQDADIFKDKMGGFRKSLKNIADLTFINAPFVIPAEEQSDAIYGNNIMREVVSSKTGCSWWFNSENRTFHSKLKSKHAIGFQETMNLIHDVFKSVGPFDGILGFSQGASLASLICGLKEHNEFPFDFHFAIIVAGFESLVESHQYLYDKAITTESLHIVGENDTCIPKELSMGLAEKFQSPEVVCHDGGHLVPTQCDVRKQYKDFLEKMLEKINKSSSSNV